jgi:hypothetical protein
VGGVDEREQVADRHRLDALGPERLHRAHHRRLVERDEDTPARVEPLGDAQAAPARGEERRHLGIHAEVVHPRALHPAHLEQVLEALGGEDGGHRALVLEDRVGRDGGAVDEALDVGGLRAGQGEHPGDRGRDAVQEVLGRAGHLRQRQAALGVEGHDVGEGAADVDADLHRDPPWARPGYHADADRRLDGGDVPA